MWGEKLPKDPSSGPTPLPQLFLLLCAAAAACGVQITSPFLVFFLTKIMSVIQCPAQQLHHVLRAGTGSSEFTADGKESWKLKFCVWNTGSDLTGLSEQPNPWNYANIRLWI